MHNFKRFSLGILDKSFIYLVCIPFIIGTIYLFFIASDRYISSAGFAVRSMNSHSSEDFLGSVTGLASSGSSTSDSYMIMRFLESRDLLDSLLLEFDFNKIYGNKDVDFLSRFNSRSQKEKILDYWKWYIKSSFDPSSGIITFSVQSFDPEDAHAISNFILQKVRILVNEISEKAREEVLIYAENEVQLAENRLIEARKEFSEFRGKTQSFDLSAQAHSQIEIIASLEKELINLNSRIHALSEYLDSDAPSIKSLKKRSIALESQIFDRKGGLNITGYNDKLLELLSIEEMAISEKSFAEEAYYSAIKNLESARIDAARNQRYLAVFAKPYLPESSIYPKRLLFSTWLLISLFIIWGILKLLLQSIGDHIRSGWID